MSGCTAGGGAGPCHVQLHRHTRLPPVPPHRPACCLPHRPACAPHRCRYRRAWARGKRRGRRLKLLLQQLDWRGYVTLHAGGTLAVTELGWRFEGQPLPPAAEHRWAIQQKEERGRELQQEGQLRRLQKQHNAAVKRLRAQLDEAAGGAAPPAGPLHQLALAAMAQCQPGKHSGLEALQGQLCSMWRCGALPGRGRWRACPPGRCMWGTAGGPPLPTPSPPCSRTPQPARSLWQMHGGPAKLRALLRDLLVRRLAHYSGPKDDRWQLLAPEGAVGQRWRAAGEPPWWAAGGGAGADAAQAQALRELQALEG